jgi:hypothetical protein
MLMHMVSFKYKADTSEAQREDHRRRLAELVTLKGVLDLKVGPDVVGSPRSYDTGLIVTFPNRSALDGYQTDPEHVPVAQLGVSICEHIVAVDF